MEGTVYTESFERIPRKADMDFKLTIFSDYI